MSETPRHIHCVKPEHTGALLTPDRQIWPNDELLVRKVASVG